MEISKQFIPYEQALELKELGFNEMCIATYDEELELETQDFEQNYNTFPKHIIAAPLWSQAFDWFREKYHLDSYIIQENYRFYSFEIKQICLSDNEVPYSFGDWGIKSYEEARLECLKKLIEIVKENVLANQSRSK